MQPLPLLRGDTAKIEVSLKETSDITSFENYTVFLTLKPELDTDVRDRAAIIAKQIEVTTDIDTVEFDLSHADTLRPNKEYFGNIRLTKNGDQEVISSQNFKFILDVGATQRI